MMVQYLKTGNQDKFCALLINTHLICFYLKKNYPFLIFLFYCFLPDFYLNETDKSSLGH